VTREALGEVRAAVSGYARPTVAGELAGARRALEAAGIEPQLDAMVDLPEQVDEVLAWTIREGTTNVLRHSGASTARILVAGGRDHAAVEVVDDGPAPPPADGDGHGLAGLRERAARVGGSGRGRTGAGRRLPVAGRGAAGVIRVLIAEDQAMVREALAALLGLEHDIEVVAQVGRGDEVLRRSARRRARRRAARHRDAGRGGLEVAERLRGELPESGPDPDDLRAPGYLRRAFDAGATGFLLKDAPAAQLASAIRRAMTGERVVDPDLAVAALGAGRQPADGARARGARPRTRRRHDRRDRERPAPLPRHSAQSTSRR
jgi:two-component system response regulator DesR